MNNFFEGKKVLITGASGFVGRNLFEKITEYRQTEFNPIALELSGIGLLIFHKHKNSDPDSQYSKDQIRADKVAHHKHHSGRQRKHGVKTFVDFFENRDYLDNQHQRDHHTQAGHNRRINHCRFYLAFQGGGRFEISSDAVEYLA